MRNFIFFASYYEAIKELPVDKQGQVYKAIVDYAMEGTEPNNLKGIQKSVFILIKPYIDSSKKKQESGAMGGNVTSKHTSKQGSKDTSKSASNNISAITSEDTSNQPSNQIIEYEEEKEYIKKEINKEKTPSLRIVNFTLALKKNSKILMFVKSLKIMLKCEKLWERIRQ